MRSGKASDKNFRESQWWALFFVVSLYGVQNAVAFVILLLSFVILSLVTRHPTTHHPSPVTSVTPPFITRHLSPVTPPLITRHPSPQSPYWRLNGFSPVISAVFSHLQQITGFPPVIRSQFEGNEEI